MPILGPQQLVHGQSAVQAVARHRGRVVGVLCPFVHRVNADLIGGKGQGGKCHHVSTGTPERASSQKAAVFLPLVGVRNLQLARRGSCVLDGEVVHQRVIHAHAAPEAAICEVVAPRPAQRAKRLIHHAPDGSGVRQQPDAHGICTALANNHLHLLRGCLAGFGGKQGKLYHLRRRALLCALDGLSAGGAFRVTFCGCRHSANALLSRCRISDQPVGAASHTAGHPARLHAAAA